MTDSLVERPVSVVGIGASAGGVEAFHAFFDNLPADTGMAFVVVLHLPAERKSLLPDILGHWTSMPVVEATDACFIEPNHVYVPPSGVGVLMSDGRLHLHPAVFNEPREACPINVFFNSLAVAVEAEAIGVVLSGTGSDGALGLKAIKARGGLTLAQGGDPQHGGMPASAIATGAVDIIAPVNEMPAHILAVRAARRAAAETDDLSAAEIETARLEICSVLRQQLDHDFSGYKARTFLRRVQRRMQVLGLHSLTAYVTRLQGDREEVAMLFRDLLIGVTAFFRDPETFEVVARRVLPRIFAGKGPADVVRVWTPGCATGEEAYAIAMLLHEHVAGLGPNAPKIHVFATDIDESAVSIARAGRYPSTLLEELAPDRLAKFFVPGPDRFYTVTKEVRDVCTFSVHSLIRDPPFSRIDLVSCRNLLIYLDADLQGFVIPAFHYSLTPNGILLLGSSETISRHENLFAPFDRPHRIFERRDTPTPPLKLMEGGAKAGGKPASGPTFAVPGSRARASVLSGRAGARVLERFAPPFVVVREDGEIIQFSSRTGFFLEPPSGLPNPSVLDMARRGLRGPVRALLRKSVETRRPVEQAGVMVNVPGQGARRITLAIEPLVEAGGEPTYLLVFLDTPAPEEIGRPQAPSDGAAEMAHDGQLESELRDTREQLQSITEEHETALEELRSANEELHSVNEELQSANEELETSKEEIQSINEELQTVNSQLAGKVNELDQKNSDLHNLFSITQVATIFLDQHLVIRDFTPAVAGLYNLIPSDRGRSLTDIATRLHYSELRGDVREVLSSLEPLERRLTRDDKSHFLMRILPYRTPDSAVDGVVVTFVEVTSMVQAEEHQKLLIDELNHRVKNMLTVVISLASQTVRQSRSLEEFSETFLARVHALTAAYSLLSSESWGPVALRDVVMQEMSPFINSQRGNVRVEGPVVQLEPRGALAMSMAIHELTTNAVKYGALSISEGTVAVKWRVHGEGDESSLELDWIEQHGPPVAPPSRRGFGMIMIERGLRQDMSAEVSVEFAAAGLRARVKAPLGSGM